MGRTSMMWMEGRPMRPQRTTLMAICTIDSWSQQAAKTWQANCVDSVNTCKADGFWCDRNAFPEEDCNDFVPGRKNTKMKPKLLPSWEMVITLLMMQNSLSVTLATMLLHSFSPSVWKESNVSAWRPDSTIEPEPLSKSHSLSDSWWTKWKFPDKQNAITLRKCSL